MADLHQIVRELQERRAEAAADLQKLDNAVKVLTGIATLSGLGRRSRGRRGRLSADAKRRISEAQKARWAKVKKQKQKG